jgi:hypothetical protein
MASFAENRRKFWVEWLAVGLLLTGAFLFVNADSIGGLASPKPSIRGWMAITPQGALSIAAFLVSIPIFFLGLSLFLVRPILLLGPNCPSWEIVVLGAIVFPWSDNICRAANPGGIHSAWLDNCRLVLPPTGIGLFSGLF